MDEKKKSYSAIPAILAGFGGAILNAAAYEFLMPPFECCATVTHHPVFLLLIYLVEIVLIIFSKIKGIGGTRLGNFIWSLFVFSVLFLVPIFFLNNLGVFCPSCPSEVISASGFIINQAVYSHATGNLTVTMTQTSGQTWNQWALVYLPAGSTAIHNDVPDNTLNWIAETTPLVSGQHQTLTGNSAIPVSGKVSVGMLMQGQLWACYAITGPMGTMQINGPDFELQNDSGPCVDLGQTVYYAQIGLVNTRAI